MNDFNTRNNAKDTLTIKLPDVPAHIYLLREDLNSKNKTNLKRYMEKSSQ